jgi:predicted metalloprotease
VLKSTEDVWSQVFSERGARYEPPVLVLFSDATQSACGLGQSAMGPFYCPRDRKVYLDLSFFRELADRFGAPENSHAPTSWHTRSGITCRR